jgi:hypothetical protein
MGDLCFTLLGPPEVRHDDQVLLFSTRKELALLIYLAVEGRVHLRKNLSEQFWPEGDAMHGRAAFVLLCSICVICWVRALILCLTFSSNATPSAWISPPRSNSICIPSTKPGRWRARRHARH